MSGSDGAVIDGAARARTAEVAHTLAIAAINPFKGWVDLCHALNIHDASGNWSLSYILYETSGWREANLVTRQAIQDLALTVLKEWPARYPEHRHHDQVASLGFMAALLLAHTAPDRLDALTADEWRFWLPGLVASGADMADRDHLQRLANVAYRRFPDDVRTEVASLLRSPELGDDAVALLWAFDPCRDGSLANVLADALADHLLPNPSRSAVVRALLHAGDGRAATTALQWVADYAVDNDRAILAVRALLSNGDADAIGKLKGLLAADVSFARRAMLASARLGEDQSASLWHVPIPLRTNFYLLLEEWFPTADDPEHPSGEDFEATARDDVAFVRRRLLWGVARTGTWEAVSELERVTATRPDLALPRELWHEAEQAALRADWSPSADPRAVLAVVADAQRRILRTPDQLLDLVLESLGRLQEHLTVDGAVADLWSEWKEGREEFFRPKLELSFADYVKRFLDQDLARYTIVNNREVENRRGNETDILVEYMDRDEGGRPQRLAVVVQAKGSWHDEVLSAMETQLAGRYLVDYQANRGVYLVGWFQCDRWDSRRPERSRPAGHTLTSLRQFLTDQAQELSDERRRMEAVVLDAAWPLPSVPRV